MLHTKYFLNDIVRFLVFKHSYSKLIEAPQTIVGELILWINLPQYKKLRILIFIFLTIFSMGNTLFISKKQTKVFFYISINLQVILNLLNAYLSNVDISINRLLAHRGKNILIIFLSYNKIPLIPELDNFFEYVISLLTFIDDNLLGLKLYVDTTSLISAETLLRFFNLPIFLNNSI